MLGGDAERGSFTYFSGYSATAQRTGKKPSYLDRISNTMQETIEGLSRAILQVLIKRERGYPAAEKIEDRSRIGVLRCQ